MLYATLVTVNSWDNYREQIHRFESEDQVLKFLYDTTRFNKETLMFTYPTFRDSDEAETEAPVEQVFFELNGKSKEYFRDLTAYQFVMLLNKYHDAYVFYGWIGTEIIGNLGACGCLYNPYSLEEAKKLLTLTRNWYSRKANEALEKSNGDFELDIKVVMSQTGCTHEEAREALKKNEGDIVNAIMEFN